MQYGVEQGDGYFRMALATFLSDGYGFPIQAENLLITTGISNALDLLCSYFTKAGDTIFVEEPSYFLALRIFADHGLNVVSVETDEEALIPASLEEKLTESRPRFLYLIPTFQNPTGHTLTQDRRDQMVKLAEKHDFFIAADEAKLGEGKNEMETEFESYWNAKQVMVGGVSSSFRINPFTRQPIYLSNADGAHFCDLNGRQFVDFFMGHGACTLGHARPEIIAALQEVFALGFFAEYDHPLTSQLARKIVEHIPCAELVRYVNSGSEATLLSIRLARGYTGRQKIVRIDGHFHGGHDYALLNNLAAFVDRSNPGNQLSKIIHSSAGIPTLVDETLYVIPWNKAEVFGNLACQHGHEIAAIIMNPIDYNNGCIGSSTAYLQAIRDIWDKHGILFIIDEILAGFRTGITCAQGYYGVKPDLCLLGKALTNGVPLAAVAGKAEVMQKIKDPVDPVVAGGTFSGNLFGCAAGIAALGIMEQPGFFESWLRRTDKFYNMYLLRTQVDPAGLIVEAEEGNNAAQVYFGLYGERLVVFGIDPPPASGLQGDARSKVSIYLSGRLI